MFALDLQPNSFIQCPKIRNVSILYIAGYTGAYTGQVSLGGGASRLTDIPPYLVLNCLPLYLLFMLFVHDSW